MDVGDIGFVWLCWIGCWTRRVSFTSSMRVNTRQKCLEEIIMVVVMSSWFGCDLDNFTK